MALILASPATADDPARLLAPDRGEVLASSAELELRLQRAEAVHRALARLQNRLMDLAGPTAPLRCSDPQVGSLVLRTRAFGAAHRDATQNARAQADRVQRMLSSPSAGPLLEPRFVAGAEAQLDRAAAQVELHRVAARRQAVHVEGRRLRGPCPATSWASPGLPEPLPGEAARGVAVIGFEGGTVCPGAHPADGRVVVVPEGLACLADDEGCSCTPRKVLPGAVLAPPDPALHPGALLAPR